MKIRDRVAALFDRAAKWMPRVTAWLWVPSLVVAVYASTLWAFESSTPEFLSWLGTTEAVLLFLATTVLGVLYNQANRRCWRAKAWLSLATWAGVLAALNVTLAEIGMPFSGSSGPSWVDIAFGVDLPASVFENAQGLLLDLLNLRWLVVIGLFAVVMELHRKWLEQPDASLSVPIGGRWKPVPALVLAVVAAVVVEIYSPFLTVQLLSVGEIGVIDNGLFGIADIIDLLIVWFSGMAVYAWKTGASLSVDRRRLRVSLAGTELGLFTIPWRRVLRLREVTLAGKQDALIVVAGVLPWFRARFAVHTRRDGEAALAIIEEESEKQGVSREHVAVRRGVSLAGWILLASGLVCGWLVMHTTKLSALAMADSSDLATDFVGADHFVLLGALTAGAALLLGLGLGFLFARTDGAIRPVPLIGVAVAASWLPDPLIYWLVYIAIFAILIARAGPVELIPAVPFPDVDVAVFGMWLVGAKALFGVGGYVIGLMIAVRPWYRALPSCPYNLPWAKKRASDESPVAIDAKLDSRAV